MALEVVVSQATASKRRVYFQLVDATDGITAETGENGGQPQISVNGAAWTNTGIGTLTAIGNGRYYADLTQAIVGTVGDIIETRYKSAATAECPGDSVKVISEPAISVDDLISGLIENIPALQLARTNPQSALIVASQSRGYTKDVVLLNSAGVAVVPITDDVLRAIIQRTGEDAVLTVTSAAATAAGSSFTKNSPSSGTNRLRLDASDLSFTPGTYTLRIDYFDSADAGEWRAVEDHVFILEP